MLKFLRHLDPVAPLRKGDAEKVRQGAGDVDHLVRAARFRQPDDGVQRVVEKVGVDLRLQGAQFALFEVFLLAAALLHQLFQPPGHDVEALGEVGKLGHARLRGAGAQIARRQQPGEVFQLPDGRADGPRQPPLRVHGQRQRQQEQAHFQQQRGDHHALEGGAFLHGADDLHLDVVLQHVLAQRRHVAYLIVLGHGLFHGGAAFDLLAQLHHLFAQRVHGAARHGQLQLVVAVGGGHQRVQFAADLVQHGKEARILEGLVAGHHVPRLAGDVHGHEGL